MKIVTVIIVSLIPFYFAPQTALAQTNEDIPRLIAALKDNDASVRRRAASDLGLIGREVPDVVPALIAALKDNVAQVRAEAASALGHIGPAAHDAVPALIAALRDNNADVREFAALSPANRPCGSS